MNKPTHSQLKQWMAELGLKVQPATVILVRDATLPKGERFPGWAVVLDPDGEALDAWPCRTVPSANELRKKGRHQHGTAIIEANVVHAACWKLGHHNPKTYGSERPCLRQVATITVHRDDDGDAVPEWTRSSESWSNGRGLNLHDWRGSSAGCPTMGAEDLAKLLAKVVRLQTFADYPERWDLLVLEPLLTCDS